MLLKRLNPNSKPMQLAIFMSGFGSNAKKIIEKYIEQRDQGNPSFEPALIFTDNPDSNAFKIATQDYKDKGIKIPCFCNPIREFYEKQGSDKLRDMKVRKQYDLYQRNILNTFDIDSIALAGYDYIVTNNINWGFLTFNVHPGDLRETEDSGKRKYTGLAWVPSAKAILDGKNEVYTSVHIVTEELDGGPLLAVSAPQQVPEEVCSLEDRTQLLGEAKSIRAISRFIRQNPEVDDKELSAKFPLYGHACDCQERLKKHGDWVIFPQVVVDIATGRYKKDMEMGDLYFDEQPIPNGVDYGGK